MSVAVGIGAVLSLFIIIGSAHAAFGGPTCNVPTDYATIQGAVNDAGCTTINVAAGTYTEHVTVNRSVVLNGANMGTLGSSTSRVPESIVDGTDTDAAFIVNADNVTIDGFTVRNGSNGGFQSGIWSAGTNDNLVIQNNVITANAVGVGPFCGTNCTIQRNLFDSNNKGGSAGGTAIYLENSTGLTINNNEFRNHTVNNPVLLATTVATSPSHTSLTFTNNSLHGNSFSNAYILGVSGGTFTNNWILPASDSTGIAFGGGDSNIQVTGNTIINGARGVRVEDDGYGIGNNSGVVINRNNLSGDTNYGIGNLSAGTVDGTCNWWGAANGPGPVGPGSGSPVTTNVTFSNWLTTSDLSGACNGPLPTVTVTIHKYVDGVHADTTNAENLSFPMQSSWNDPGGIGVGSGSYALAPSTYDAQTSNMNSGAGYSTNEDTTGPNVGASCADGKPFALVAYSTGDSEAAAFAAASSTASPALTNITTNKHVIVWNKDCTPATLTIVKKAINANDTFNFTVTGGPSTPSVLAITTVGGSGTSSPIQLESGTYNVNELTPPSGWTLNNVSCVYNNQSVGNSIAGGEQITVDAGDAVTCTFTNTKQLPDVTVTIIKAINGAHATAANANSAAFTMVSSWNAANLGGAGSGSYTLGPVGFNTANAYEAVTSNMTAGSSYTTNEDTSTSVVGPNCAAGKPFALNGYSTGDSQAAAQAAPVTATIPSFTNITTNKYVIVWNVPCASTPPPPPANACDLNTTPAGFTRVNGGNGNDHVTLAPNTMYVDKGGNNVITAGNGPHIICTGSGNDSITVGNGDNIIDAGGGNNVVKTGNGNQNIKTGSGNDAITIGNGASTIDAGGGNNSVTTGNGDQTVTTGAGNDNVTTGNGDDTINVGNGNNTVKSGAGKDSITSGSGNDNLDGGAGNSDKCVAGGGNNIKTGCEL